MTTHIMVDIETVGKRPGCVVLSVALVRFSDEAHCTLNLSVPDQTALGLEIDAETHAWWGTQSPEAWAAATSSPVPLRDALAYLSTWLAWATGGADWLIWCHGATFDAPILEELYRRMGLPTPWPYWGVRCTRTLYDLAGISPKEYAVPPPHVALNDAVGQTRAANAALAILSRAHGRDPSERRQMAELAISNGECAAQIEIKDATLRGALVDNVLAAFT